MTFMKDIRRSLEDKMSDIRRTYDNALEEYGDLVHAKMVLPFCRKHKMLFIGSEREYYFVPLHQAHLPVHKRDYIHSFRDAELFGCTAEMTQDFANIFLVLDIELSKYKNVGNLVHSVQPYEIS